MSEVTEIMALFQLASDSPSEALPQLWQALEQANKVGNKTRAHALRDGILSLLIYYQTELDKAEKLALELVESIPDKFHLELLARVFGLRGDTSRQTETEKRARAAEDRHDSPRLREIRERVYGKYLKT